MGYNGKPSQGCETCRKRKIGCDKLTPSCTQCNRSGRPCPGYRDPLSLHFRDVTEQVMRKEQARTSETPESSSSSSEHSPDTSTNTIVRRRAGSRKTHASARLSRNASLIETGAGADPPPRADVDMDQDTVHNFVYYPFVTGPLVRPTKEEAVCYFLHAHDFPGSPFITRNVTTLISARKSLGQRALESGIAAASLALMSRARDVHALRYTACQEYVTALKLVNRTLADPKEAKTDQALAAVTMLALYELISARRPRGLDGWKNHSRGVAALLEIRGVKLLKSVIGLELYRHTRHQMLLDCFQNNTRVPQVLEEGAKLSMILQPDGHLGDKMFLIWCSMSHLRADIQEQAITDPNKILAKAYTIEQDLNTWFANLPPSFSYTTHIVPPNSYTIKQKCRGITPYNNKYHIYNAFWISELYNQYRCMRILVSEIIFSHLQKLPSPTASCREHEHRALISHFSDEICHSIPFSLGACNSETPPEVRAVPPENYIAGLLLIWPLYLAGAAEQLSHPRRRWVLHAARVIGHSMGVELGLRIMDILNVAPCILDEEEIWSDEISVKYVKEGDGVDCAG